MRMLKGSGTVIRFMKWKATRTHQTHQNSLTYVQNETHESGCSFKHILYPDNTCTTQIVKAT